MTRILFIILKDFLKKFFSNLPLFIFLKKFFSKSPLKEFLEKFFSNLPLKRYLAITSLLIINGCIPLCIFLLIVDFYFTESVIFTKFFEDEAFVDHLKLCYFYVCKLSLFLHILISIIILYYDYIYKNIYELRLFKSKLVQQLLFSFIFILVIAIYLF